MERHTPVDPLVDLAFLEDMVGSIEDGLPILQSFVAQATETVARIDNALAALDRNGVRDAAHRLKGGARTVGTPRLASAAAELQDWAGEERAWAEAEPLVAALQAALRETADAIARL